MAPKCVRLLLLLSCVAGPEVMSDGCSCDLKSGEVNAVVEEGSFPCVCPQNIKPTHYRSRDRSKRLVLEHSVFRSPSSYTQLQVTLHHYPAVLRPSCPPGWFYYKAHCYGYLRKLGSWSHAELECQSYGSGSHLASVLDQKEASVISRYIFGYQRNLPVWIGLHDPEKKQLWKWIDGSSQPYRPWNLSTKSDARHCAVLNPKSRFLTWNKNSCNEQHHFLCKFKP